MPKQLRFSPILTIQGFWILFIILLLHVNPVETVGAAETSPFIVDPQKVQRLLTADEKQWLAEHNTITVAGPKAFPPFHYYDDENIPKGMAADYISHILNLLSLKLKIEPGIPWPEVLSRAKERRIDLIACSAKTTERETYLAFSDAYLSFPMVILTRTDAPFIGGLKDLRGEKVTFVKKGAVYDWIRRDKIGVQPYFVDSPIDALEAVALGRAEAHIENLAAATYLINNNGLANLKVAAPTAYGNYNLYIAVRDDWPELTSIINKALSVISPQQHTRIRNRWLALSIEPGVDRSTIVTWIVGIGGVSIFIIGAILTWNRRLSREIRERKRIEDSLIESEARFRTLFEQAAVGVAQMESKTGRFIRINQRFCDIVGYSLEEMIQKTFMQITHPMDLQTDLDHIKELLDGRICEYVVEKRYLRKDGEAVWVNLTVSAMWAPDQTPDYHIAIIEDISDKKRSEKALEESRRQLTTLIGNLPGMAYRCHNAFDWKMEFVSGGSEPLTGYQPEALIKNKSIAYADIIHPDDRQKVWSEVQTAVQERSPFELVYRINTARGEQKWVWEMGRAIYDDQEHAKAIEGFITDITNRISAEKELNRSIAEWQTTFDAVNAAIWILDKKQRIVRSNKNVTPFFDKPYQELIGQKCWAVLHDEKRPDPKCPLPMARKSLQRETMDVETENGWFEIAVDPILDSNGRYAGAVHIATDITKRKLNELEKEKLSAQLIQSQKMESVGRLAGGVAHDFNNMLSVITGHAELALEDTDISFSLHQDLEEILKAAQRSADLTRQLLAFARKQAAVPKVLDLNDTIAGTLKMLRRLIGEEINLIWIPGADLWSVKIDPAQLDQVLANLCVNGRDAIEGVGKITIETQNIVLGKTFCDEHPGCISGEYSLMAVNDDGHGIEKEIRDNIFEPFFTTKEAGRGTGLGLATVYGIVKQNNGFIDVESEPGKGTTFHIYLPRIKKKVEEKTPPTEEIDFTGTETILLVEDELTVLKLAERILLSFGYTVFSAGTPAHAIHLAEQNPDIDLMITDVVMPEMNGQALKEKITLMIPGIRTLFMSGYTSDVISHRGIIEDEAHYIPKPFTVDSLGAKVREVLEQG